MYNHIRNLYLINYYKCNWMEFIKKILQDCDLLNIWNSQQFHSIDWLKSVVGKKLKENYIRKWNSELNQMTSCDVYIHFKLNFTLEDYLIHLPLNLRRTICALRTNNTRLPKVVGRFTKTPREQRFCTLCPNESLVGDEYHLLLECKNPQIVIYRNKYIADIYTRHPSMQKCIDLLGSNDMAEIRKLSYFLKNCLPLFN